MLEKFDPHHGNEPPTSYRQHNPSRLVGLNFMRRSAVCFSLNLNKDEHLHEIDDEYLKRRLSHYHFITGTTDNSLTAKAHRKKAFKKRLKCGNKKQINFCLNLMKIRRNFCDFSFAFSAFLSAFRLMARF